MPNKKEILKHRQKQVDAYKLSVGCELCGYNKHPSALCFDHLEEKHDACRSGSRPGGMYQLYNAKYDISILIDEIRKCRVLCHNCHMENTYHRNKTDIHLLIESQEELERHLRDYETNSSSQQEQRDRQEQSASLEVPGRPETLQSVDDGQDHCNGVEHPPVYRQASA